MDSVAMITAVLTLFAGVGVFLTACEMLSSNLETLGSSKLRDLFATAAKSRLLGVGIGTLGRDPELERGYRHCPGLCQRGHHEPHSGGYGHLRC